MRLPDNSAFTRNLAAQTHVTSNLPPASSSVNFAPDGISTIDETLEMIPEARVSPWPPERAAGAGTGCDGAGGGPGFETFPGTVDAGAADADSAADGDAARLRVGLASRGATPAGGEETARASAGGAPPTPRGDSRTTLGPPRPAVPATATWEAVPAPSFEVCLDNLAPH